MSWASVFLTSFGAGDVGFNNLTILGIGLLKFPVFW